MSVPSLKGAITLYANRAMHILLLLSGQDKGDIQQRSTWGPMNPARGPAAAALSVIFTSEWSWLMPTPLPSPPPPLSLSD